MARMANYNIRLMMQDNGIRRRELAKHMGITQYYLSRLLCKQLTPENSERIIKAIYEIVEVEKDAENKNQ